MHDVVAVALITGGTTVLGSGVTYLATSRQANRQAETDRERIRGEAERQRLQYDEEHVRHRQTTYHDLLMNVSAWERAYTANEILAAPGRAAWLRELDKHFSGVSLFSSQRVFATLGPLKQSVEDWTRESPESAEARARFLTAYDAAVEAMRTDTAPGF